MNPDIHPVVADTPCAKCGARVWRRVGTKTFPYVPRGRDNGVTIETYECMRALCPGAKETERGTERWPLSWAYEGVAA